MAARTRIGKVRPAGRAFLPPGGTAPLVPKDILRAGIVRHLAADDAAHAEAGIGLGIGQRHVDAIGGDGGGAVEIHVDAVLADCHGGDDVDWLVITVDAHGVLVGARLQRADLIQHRRPAVLDDVLTQRIDGVQVELAHHIDQATAAGLVAGGQRIEVALDLHRLAHIHPHDVQQRFIHHAALGQRHDRDVDAFLIDLPPIGAEAAPADIDDMAGRGEQGDHLAVLEGRRDDGKVVQMAGAEPGIVGDVNVAFLHRFRREPLQEEADRGRHRVHMAGRTGDRLGQHAAACVEHAGGQIAGLAHGGREGGADQRLRLFLDDREQAVPHDLQMDLVERGILGHGASFLRRPACGREQYSPAR